MHFEFATAKRIIFGAGKLAKVSDVAASMGQKALIVCGSGSVPLKGLLAVFKAAGTAFEIFRIEHEPDILAVEAGIALAKSEGCDFVVGFGGGSSLDTGKAISAILTNPGELMDYLEVIGGAKKIPNPAAPMIALPTTAGTGTEVTRNAVIASPAHHVKVSMRSPLMIPQVALVDPQLTLTMPPSVTASTGMDALTQVIEAYVSNRANVMTDIVSREGIIRGSRSLLAAFRNGQDSAAREDMALTSLFGGLALANGGLGAVHGFAGPIGGMFKAPHGAICASLLPYVMKHNAEKIRSMDDPSLGAVVDRYEKVARWMTGNPNASIEDGVAFIEALAADLQIPGLREIGIQSDDFDRIIEKSKVSFSMQKNPICLDEATLKKILQEAL
jgi:alcohol dehydrogenase class IV